MYMYIIYRIIYRIIYCIPPLSLSLYVLLWMWFAAVQHDLLTSCSHT